MQTENKLTASEKVPPAGLEPATSALEERCSIQLSYEGMLYFLDH